MTEQLSKTNETLIIGNMPLSASVSREIMEATGRFHFVKEEPEKNLMTFWDSSWEKEHTIQSNWTLQNLMKWIIEFYAEDYEWRGELKAQRKIRAALGIE